jgi:hypothetical protein
MLLGRRIETSHKFVADEQAVLNKELAAKIHHSGASYGEDRAAVSE